ncbi:hypothetical protein MVES1_000562 [Malassezia vespertilionis]|uniref:Thioesterase domain-containing protein n=1 Tax=Malassezia vespertilionis TaxID=2020962 RepID=A0A2N1JGY6_9BASI|nr:uncharacterized protein MVES1_000562 [Malassezia vespertilionis]PKI85810.1 hypothetical protein MVES_000520 [Malassezia vespertilionis]WFD05234.1 hypothetical protein MVES1_000562 [Malassezia vespertilionis]
MSSVTLLSVEDVANTIEYASANMNEHGWSHEAFKSTQVRLTHLERDGVVLGSGERAKNERPKRAFNTEVRFRLVVQPHMTNSFGTMHGGCMATCIDTLSSYLIALHSSMEVGQPWLTFGVTQSLSVQYLAPGNVGKWLEFVSTPMSVGKSLAVICTDVYELEGENGGRTRRIATSQHAKVDVSGRLSKI